MDWTDTFFFIYSLDSFETLEVIQGQKGQIGSI